MKNSNQKRQQPQISSGDKVLDIAEGLWTKGLSCCYLLFHNLLVTMDATSKGNILLPQSVSVREIPYIQKALILIIAFFSFEFPSMVFFLSPSSNSSALLQHQQEILGHLKCTG
ncbi:hypothetical protein A946_04300 [Methylacidiphilum kamchatkense Kam1]|uniref:Uncharacterized protein n=1 Tax=Methylacidiphilum kamchatkense Kam1 TaxID=1202785 RepID=A0ABR4ZXC1_9BACT|nr:hypothetical protein [Methylacidiphilum kamchatkense]KIE58670.1 hypothetical protein A946_04300 [Methylacidiphilum kamchatkense Kam1]